jgi:hypothetical protein
MKRALFGLGEHPPTDGKCWIPATPTQAGRWIQADALAMCTYPSPDSVAASARSPLSLWAQIPTWAKLFGVAAIVLGGGYMLTRR